MPKLTEAQITHIQPRTARNRLLWIPLTPDPAIGFGTAPSPRSTSGACLRGKEVICLPFGTAALPTDASEACPRGKEVICLSFGTETLPTSAPEASLRGEAFF